MVLALLSVLLFQRTTFARAMAAAVPFACVCVAAGIFSVATWLRRIRGRSVVSATAFALLLLSAVSPSFLNAHGLRGKRSQVADACTVIANYRHGSVVVPPHRSIWWLYLERSGLHVIGGRQSRVLGYEDHEATLARLRRDGVRWVVTDSQWMFSGSPHDRWRRWFEWSLEWDALLRREAALTAEFPHLTDYRWEFLAEGPGVAEVAAMSQAGSGPLRIYDIQASPGSQYERLAELADSQSVPGATQ
jgi:hypothetical protein